MNLPPEVVRWIATNIVGTQAALVSSGLIGKKRLDYYIREAEKDYDSKLAAQQQEAAIKGREALAAMPFMSEFSKPFVAEEPPTVTPSPESAPP